MADAGRRQGLKTVLVLWLALVPLSSAICWVLVPLVTARIQLFHPGFPTLVTVAIYTPNEYVRLLCSVGPVGVVVPSVLLGLVVLACLWRAGRHSLWVAALALGLNLLFTTSVLTAFALELLRAFPHHGLS